MCIRNSQYWLQLGNLGGINGEEKIVDSFFLLDNFFSLFKWFICADITSVIFKNVYKNVVSPYYLCKHCAKALGDSKVIPIGNLQFFQHVNK